MAVAMKPREPMTIPMIPPVLSPLSLLLLLLVLVVLDEVELDVAEGRVVLLVCELETLPEDDELCDV